MKNYRNLQNGSDIRGVSITGAPGEIPNLTAYEAVDIGRGFTAWLCEKLGKAPEELTVAIGRDPRISGKRLAEGFMKGMGPYGVKVYDCGLASTPAMFMATIFPETSCDGGVMITASHLPYNRNGFKFFTAGGGLDKADITAILNYAENEHRCIEVLGEPGNTGGRVRDFGKLIYPMEPMNLMEIYSAHLRRLIIEGAGAGIRPLEGMKIVVDAGNGNGGFYAKDVLKPLGADVSDSQYLEPDGMFLNHAPNPEDREAITSITSQVIRTGADFGLIFDTDVDRSAAVDGRGREIAGNGIVAMAAALVADEHPKTTVVTDSITSNQLTEFIENKLGLKHLRYRRGYRNVINKAVELNGQGIDCRLAIETSGHAAFKENHFLDDGAYLATKIVIEAVRLRKDGRTLDSLIEDLKDPADEREIRIPIKGADFVSCADAALDKLKDFVCGAEGRANGLSLEEPNYEGVRVNFSDGWCLLRKSLHDPIMPMNMASDKEGGCDEIAECMRKALEGCNGLDLSVME